MLTVENSRLNKGFDWIDHTLCQSGMRRAATWDDVLVQTDPKLYAEKLRRGLPQWATHYGLTPFFPNSRNIYHDLCNQHDLPDESVALYQAEDVFEHIAMDRVAGIFDDIFRILRPGGLFRLSVPDYRFPVYASRTLKDDSGNFLFDPGGGGSFVGGRVVGGGHLWFPTYESVREVFGRTSFSRNGKISFLQYNSSEGRGELDKIDYSLGFIQRTPDNDARAMLGMAVSIIVDAKKD